MKRIKIITAMSIFALILAGAPVAVLADEDLDVTMTVLEEGAEPETTYSIIELPPPAGKPAFAQERDGSRAASEAQKRGAEMRTQALEAARESVGNDVARGALNNLPNEVRDNVPQRPSGPGNQGPPELPQGPPSRN